MERELRNRNVLAAVRRAGKNPLVWIALAVFIAWGGYTAFAPHVTKVERDPDGLLIISGHNFGGARGDSALVYTVANNEVELEVDQWSNDRIIARPRGEVASGSVSFDRALGFLHWPASAAALVVPEEGLPSKPFGYEVPVQAAAPWPSSRRTRRNTAYLPLPAVYGGGAPWSFQTGKGVSASPVVDENGVAYVGSADHTFYAINPDGSERWRYRTGGVIQSAAALVRPGEPGGSPTVVFGSGDGFLYRLRTGSDVRDPATREVFAFDALVSPRSKDDNWFAGDLAVGYDGTLYAGNSNSSYYAVTPTGELKWIYQNQGSGRSSAALADDGTIYWGSQDGSLHAVKPDGTTDWTQSTWGLITASVAIGSDGTAYLGSFDGYLYALDPESGDVLWSFKSGDHIAGSVALGEDKDGTTDVIYFGSADGRLYALNPKGEQMWAYDTGSPIRSSPAVGLGPNGEHPGIVYFGGGDGRLYALNAIDGQRRWSFDTTANDSDLADRNDLNSSVALGQSGIHVGSESGHVWYVPYDYCLHADDARCSTAPGEELTEETTGLVYVSPGGTTHFEEAPPIAAASVITLRLVVRNGSGTVDAHLCNTPLLCSASDLRIESEPSFPFRTEISPDGRYVHIVPEKILEAGTAYRLNIEGDYYTDGYRVGSFNVGGSQTGHFKTEITLRTRPGKGSSPLIAKGEEIPALAWTRLALPLPTMMGSVGQGALDDIELIVAAVGVRPVKEGSGRLILWGIGGQRDNKGTLVADPDSEVTLTLSGAYQGDSFAAIGQSFELKVGPRSIPFDRLDVRGQLDADGGALPGATLFGVTDAASLPGIGPSLATDAANAIYGNVAMAGTYLAKPYPRSGPANKRPQGLQVSFVEWVLPTSGLPGQVVAHFRLARGASYKLAEHRLAIILIDRLEDAVVPLDYASQITASATPEGDVSHVVLTIPEGMELSQELSVIVLADVFPLHREKLEKPSQAK